MTISVQSGLSLTFERFWRWLLEHSNCLLRAGTSDAVLYDLEELHWQLDEDEDHNPMIQVVRGKQLVGELVLDVRELLFVQVTRDPDAEESGRYLFELIGGPKEEPFPLYHFLMSHGLEEQELGHAGGLKH
ncbi:MAG: hypothetical protein HYZ28_11685 [Myxococcales bacterium]|nr:hypothetical protein [Myxococcales bacterium]